MVLGVIRLRIRMPNVRSLKEKRGIVKSILGKIRSRFNVAASEVAQNDLWHNAEIGICAVGNSESVVNSVLDKVLDFVEFNMPAEIIEPEIEIIHVG